MKRPLVEWRHRGCRCLLLQAYLSPQGWQVVIPSHPEEFPNQHSAIPGGWTGNEADQWVRIGRSARRDRKWSLPLDRESWDLPALHVACSHGVVASTEELLLGDVGKAVATRRRVFRDLSGRGV